MKKLALFVVMLALSAGAFAQHGDPPPGPPNGTPNGKPTQTPAQIAAEEVKFLAILLDLNSDQQKKALTLFTTAETNKAKIVTDHLDKDQATLLSTVLAGAGIDSAAAAVGADLGNIAAEEGKAQSALYNDSSLTSDQKAKYKAFLEGEFVVPGDGKGPGNGKGHGPHGH